MRQNKLNKKQVEVLETIKRDGHVKIFGNNDKDKLKIRAICKLCEMGLIKFEETVGVTDYFILK